MKKILLSAIFIVIFIFIYNYYDNVIIYKMNNKNIQSYYLEHRPIDILFIGTSRIFHTMSPMYIWSKYGIISYNRANEGQFYKNTYYLSKEFILRNKPKLIVIDTYLIETALRREYSIQHLKLMKFSFLKIRAFLDIYDNNFFDLLYAYTNIDEYHSRWKELKENDFNPIQYLKGYIGNRYTITPQLKKLTNNPHIMYNELQEDPILYMKELIDYAKLNNINILFLKMPSNRSKQEEYLDNQFKLLADDNRWDFINYNLMYDEIKLDFNKDFRDWSHLNVYGGRKVMDHLVPYIIENYNIPNRKDDPAYVSWNEDYLKYARYENKVLLNGIKSFQEWQNLAYYDNYTMLISTNGDDVLNRLPQDMKDKFKTLGLNKFETDKKNQKYVAIIDDNQVFYEEVSDKKAEYKGRMKNIVNLLVSSENKKATINVSGKPRAKNKYGINFVIYDKVNREIVDSIWIDPKNFNQVRR